MSFGEQWMDSEKQIVFGIFRLDLLNECLWRNEQFIALAPKEFAVLLHLVRHTGQLVTKEELIEAVWPETSVTDGVLKVSIRKIRAALGDDASSPKFIETAHRRGYRFIGTIEEESSQEQSTRRVTGRFGATSPLRISVSPSVSLVGRESALEQMRGYLKRARSGDRQIVFITGEAGIGKTSLVENFLQEVAQDPQVWIGQGQCLEQYGSGEGYLPVLEALSRLCQEPGRQRLIELLRRQAPTWLQQMPWLIGEADRESLKREVIGATGERMLREMAEALEALTAETPFVFVLEDLHWSDYSTLDLVSYLARRRKPAQLLLIATYRPVDVALSEHPLKGVKQELQAHRLCDELPLEYLSQEMVGEYLPVRFPQHQFPGEFTALLHGRTDGNPLFMVNAIDYLQAEGLIAEANGQWQLTVALSALEVGVPESIRQMIEKQIERLGRPQQRLLEVASVAGAEFSTIAIAAGLEQGLREIEEQCEELERRHQFLRSTGVSTLPNGKVMARYGFIHALYQQVLYQRVAAGRRVRLHQLIGEGGEQIYGEHVGEIAAEMAMHFERSHDYRRAVRHLRQAAQNHFLRYANREAIAYLSRALELVERLPEAAERPEVRIAVLEQEGLARRAMGDMSGSAEAFSTLVDYAQEQGRVEDEVKALIDLATALSWIDREQCLAAAERFVALSRALPNQLLQAHALGSWSYWHVLFIGWGHEHAEALAAAITAAREDGNRAILGLHLARYCFFECLRSNYQASYRAGEEASQLALGLSDAHSYLLSQYYQAWALLHMGRWGEMRRILDEGLEMAKRNESRRWEVLFRIEQAWLHMQAFDLERGRDMCEQALEQARRIQHPYTESLSMILLGMVHLMLEQNEEGFRCFNEVAVRLERERGLMDWILQILLHNGLSRYWLYRGDLVQARREAELVCELAMRPGERTYVALGYRVLAEIAMAGKEWEAAEAAVSRSLAVIEGAEAPLAEWRVRTTAAQFYEQLGRTDEAAQQSRRGAEVLSNLAGSLAETDPLRQSVLAAPAVRVLRAEF